MRTNLFIVRIPPEVTTNNDFPADDGDDNVVIVESAWYHYNRVQSSVSLCLSTHVLTYIRARADPEEAKGEKEGEDVDSPPGDRNRIMR